MLRVEDKKQLINLFRERDQEDLVIPQDMKFPLPVVDYLAWREPSGHRTYLVVGDKMGDHPFGIVFERAKASENVPMMCNWCHAVRPASDVALLTARVDKKTRVGIHLCSDLKCKENLLDRPSIHDMRETLDRGEKRIRLLQKIQSFINHEIL